MIAGASAPIDVHKDRLMVRFKSAGTEKDLIRQMVNYCRSWKKPPSRKSDRS